MGAEPDTGPPKCTPDFPRLCRYLSERSPQPMVAVEGTSHVVVYLNPAFARLACREEAELIGRPFAEAVPEGEANGCLALLDHVFRTGTPEKLAEQEHRPTHDNRPVYWSYAVWAILGDDERPIGAMVQVTDSTEAALDRERVVAMNEALVVSAARQHELTEAAEALGAQLREARDWHEARVAERTAELAATNARLTAEIVTRKVAETDRGNLLRRLATVQEDERRQIARDLHDHVGQLLAVLSLGLKALEWAIPDSSPAQPHLARLREITGLIDRGSHQLALQLRPTALDDLGLVAALATYADVWSERSAVAVEFHAAGPDAGRLPKATETALYRVVQEALTNVLRHAQACRVSIVLQRFPGQTVAVVEDDGVGFDAESAPAGGGGRLGLLGMRERLAQVDGTLTVESAAGRGTTVIARVPSSIGAADADTGTAKRIPYIPDPPKEG